MAVVSFWGNNKKETGQTLSVIAIGTTMAIEHNYKILIVSTGFRDTTVEDCFWEKDKSNNLVSSLRGTGLTGLNNGIEGLVKIIQSNRTSSNIIKDYAKVVFRDNRLDILLSPTTNDPREYNAITKYYKDLVKLADKEYDLVLIDIDKRMNVADKSAILQESNLIVITLKQGLESMNMAKTVRENMLKSRKNNIIFLAGKYDSYSKYNTKNITRYLKENREISAIPYNTLFYEATMEGKVADVILNFRNITDNNDINKKFLQETNRSCQNIVYKLQELQMRM